MVDNTIDFEDLIYIEFIRSLENDSDKKCHT